MKVVVVEGVGAVGPPGRRGEPGPAGPQGTAGPPGPASGQYRHVQGTPSATWLITHNLGFYPGGVIVTDTSGGIHDGQIEYLSLNSIRISFFAGGVPASFSGEAFIS